jgi:hypothetical protein
MDAEFLARRGARDRAGHLGGRHPGAERARRQGLDYLWSLVTSALPVRRRSVAHDGLHHHRPDAGSTGWPARRAAVSVNEPADALGTQVAVRLGIAANQEGAGNRVARLRAEELCGELRSAGFQPTARRSLMYYKHQPGRTMRFLSRPGVHRVYRWTVGLSNSAIGRWGNKLQVTAIRAA